MWEATIKLERQPGGWIWVAVMSAPCTDVAKIIGYSEEAFESKEAALADAGNAMHARGFVITSGHALV